MINVALFEPEIPPNTGNIIRLCANTGARLHLIHPLGFELDDKRLRRAGLDYSEWARVKQYPNWADFQQHTAGKRIFGISTKGHRSYADVKFSEDDFLLFGPETRGLPQQVRDTLGPEQLLRIPMLEHSRSVNLSNSVAVLVYEAWRQSDFQCGR